MSTAAAAANVYGGDEINAIVLDAGSFHTRIGYAGDDYPKVITPSYFAQSSDSSKQSKETAKVENDEEITVSNSYASKSGRIFGDSINVPRDGYEVKSIMKDSEIVDWDAAVDQYSKYFNDVLHLDFREQPILITEPVWTSTEYRKKIVETFYEEFDFPALFLAKAPTCVSFQQGRPNCLVVDIGHDSVSVTPVVDGISLLKNSMRTHYAGKYLNDQFKDLLQRKYVKSGGENVPGNFSIVPLYQVQSRVTTHYPTDPPNFQLKSAKDPKANGYPSNITQTYHDYQEEKIFHELKETLLEVPEKKLVSNNINHNNSIKELYKQDSYKRQFELPNGQSIDFAIERFQIADSLFEPHSYKFQDEALQKKYPNESGELVINTTAEEYKPLKRARKAESATSTPPPSDGKDAASTSGSSELKRKNGPNSVTGCRGLSQLITHTLSSVDIDLRSSVAHNIIITGSTSMIPKLTERLYTELSNMNPGLKIRLHATGNSTERFNQTWIGGSVLASLGTFHQMWVSKQEYEEAGSDRILSQRFR
ncbi:actin-related protein 4 [[Candida] railenensis]|uniref:Actin-related protein 4 n=1 Tax=[Candida] railenensis TaxID=45579 RepID=A0A9P0VXA6_9ASCO|nr:actin-related protein 4 [[Candida] railenensis]